MAVYDISMKRLLTSSETAQKFCIHPLSAIMRAIPEEWKRHILREKPGTFETSKVLISCNEPLLAESSQISEIEKCHQKWNADLRLTLPPLTQWSAIYTRPHNSTRNVNLRGLQY